MSYFTYEANGRTYSVRHYISDGCVFFRRDHNYHRSNGPACIHIKNIYYYLNGAQVSQTEHAVKARP